MSHYGTKREHAPCPHRRCPRRVVVQPNGIVTGNRELFTLAGRSTGLSPAISMASVGTLLAPLLDVPESILSVERRMSRPISKSGSCFELLTTVEVSIPPGRNSCFRAWSTLALFDYLHDENLGSAQNAADPSRKKDQGQAGSQSTRAELQRLLQRAYVESWKRPDNNKN